MDHRNSTFHCLAVDMGAGSIRVMLGTIQNQAISYQEIHRTKNTILEIDGHDKWDIHSIFKGIVSGINKAIEVTDREISSIGVDSWGVDFVLLDENRELLETPVAYRDKRTEGMMETWKNEMTAYETYQRTGINFYIFNTLFQLLSMRETELLSKTRTILFIPSYINFLLSGTRANEQTIGSTSQVLNIDGENWDKEIIEKLGISGSVIADVVKPGTKLGKVINDKILDQSIETVAVCGHDTACAIAALPAENQDFAYISTGTWCILGIESGKPDLSKEAFNKGFTNERGYGNTFRTLKNIVGLWLVQGLKKEMPEDVSYADLEQLVNETRQTTQFIDPDDALFFNPDHMKTAFDQFFKKTGQAQPESMGEYVKIAYDSLCFSFRYLLDFLEVSNLKKMDRIHVIGGGCQSDYFNQHIATICKKEVVSGPVEGAVYGNILVQAISLGFIDSIDEGRELVRNSITLNHYSPGKDAEKFDEVYDKYLTYKKKQSSS